jgi:tetratricopeptide (TPR) repeat protein
MYYKKLMVNNLLIEFHSDWLGVESVSVNGQLVSKKVSITGTDHPFNVIEEGRMTSYILSSKLLNGLEAGLDLRRNQRLILENVQVPMSGMAWSKKSSNSQNTSWANQSKANKLKKSGLIKLMEYDLQHAVADFTEALKMMPNDPEIYFHLACAHSVLEQKDQAFECLEKAVQLGFEHKDSILTHEMLAYIRMQDEFEAFVAAGFARQSGKKK